MTFLTPLSFLLLALIPPIIALYLLKLRRQDHMVSSTYLWQRFVRDVEANAPWQKLRRNLLLLLQILLLLLLILALARPATEASGVADQMVVLILDTSASMAATDVDSASRLDAAKATARDLVTNLPDNTRVTVLAAAGGEVNTLASASQDRRQVLAAIDSVQPTALGSNLTPALTLAEAVTTREPSAGIVLLSDGVVDVPARLSAPVRFVPIGQAAANQAISALSVNLTPTGTSNLFVQASNYGNQPAQRRLVIQVDGSPFAAFDLNIPSGGHVEQTVEALPPTARWVEAALTRTENDFLALDDQAWAVVRNAEPVQATLVTRGNFFLQTALNSLNAQKLGVTLELTVISPEDWKSGGLEDWRTGGAENRSQPSNLLTLHIFDSYIPDTLPSGNLLFIAPPASVPGLFEILGQAANPIPHPVEKDHPVLQNVDLSTTQILTTTVLSATGWSHLIAAGELQTPSTFQPSSPPALQPSSPPTSIPLLLTGEVEGRRVVILPFALQQSDLPLRPAFPILAANLVNYLVPGAANLVPVDLKPGEALSISVPAGVNQLRLITPSGIESVTEARAGRVHLSPLTEPGLYSLSFEPVSSTFSLAVNFFDPLESAIAPRPDLNLTGPAPSETHTTPPPPAHQEWWRLLAIGALILLVIEWLVYQRSAVLRYWSAVRQRMN